MKGVYDMENFAFGITIILGVVIIVSQIPDIIRAIKHNEKNSDDSKK